MYVVEFHLLGKEISWVLVSKMGSYFLLSHVAKLIVSVFFFTVVWACFFRNLTFQEPLMMF